MSPTLDDYRPPAAFSFSLQMVAGNGPIDEASFQEVSGLSMEMQTETYREGGQNMYTHELPTGLKSETLTLKRGFLTPAGPLYNWIEQSLQGNLATPLVPMNFNLQLLTPAGAGAAAQQTVLQGWTIYRAWPRKWSVSSFDSTQSQVLVETMELTYAYLTRH